MKKHLRKLNDETGVTLVELLAAIAILSIVVTAFLAFFIQAANTNQRTNKMNEATFLAQERIEEITHEGPIEYENEYEKPPNPEGYEITTEIEKLKESNLYKVIVIVSEVGEGGNDLAKMETRLPIKVKKSENDETNTEAR